MEALAAKKSCPICGSSEDPIEVIGHGGKASSECPNCMRIGQGNPVEAFSDEWWSLAKQLRALVPA